jgi:hypothetical protein
MLHFATPCIALFNCDNRLHIRVDHVGSESEFQAKQVRRVFGGPQASCSEGANIVVIKTTLGHLTMLLVFKLNLVLCFIMIVH